MSISVIIVHHFQYSGIPIKSFIIIVVVWTLVFF